MKKLTSIALFILLPVVFFLAGWYVAPSEPVAPLFCIPPPEANHTLVTRRVNEYRTSIGKKPFTSEETLCSVASIRSFQATTDWSHDGFYPISDLIYQWKPEFDTLAENLSTELLDPVPAWIESPTHKANLDGNYTYGCVRCYKTTCALILGEK